MVPKDITERSFDIGPNPVVGTVTYAPVDLEDRNEVVSHFVHAHVPASADGFRSAASTYIRVVSLQASSRQQAESIIVESDYAWFERNVRLVEYGASAEDNGVYDLGNRAFLAAMSSIRGVVVDTSTHPDVDWFDAYRYLTELRGVNMIHTVWVAFVDGDDDPGSVNR